MFVSHSSVDEYKHAARLRSKKGTISVVMPVYNESLVLPELFDAVRAALQQSGVAWEVVFVDDGSTDSSPEVLDTLAVGDQRVKVVHLSRNFGHQAAIHAGLCHARGDAVLLMDSDLQDSPEAIPRFIEAWRDGYDVVYAIRTKRKEYLLKRLLFRGFYRFLAAIASTPIPLDAGIFGLIDRRVADEIVALGERDRFYPGLRSWVGFRQKGILVERLARYDDHPRVSMRGLWRLAKTAIFSFSSFPLTVFYLIGYSALLIFVGLSSYSLFCKLFTDLAIPGWTSHILSASFFGALNALGISILGEYVIRIYDQVRGRPLYIVARAVNVGSPRIAPRQLKQRTSATGAHQQPHDDLGQAVVVCEGSADTPSAFPWANGGQAFPGVNASETTTVVPAVSEATPAVTVSGSIAEVPVCAVPGASNVPDVVSPAS